MICHLFLSTCLDVALNHAPGQHEIIGGARYLTISSGDWLVWCYLQAERASIL